MIHGLLILSSWQYIVIALFLAHINIVSVTLFLHRSQAHHAVDFHPAVAHFFRFWLWLATGMCTKEWVAVHRKHHAFSDRAADPHSPYQRGLAQILWLGVWHYRREAKCQQTLTQYGVGTPDDWLERHLYTRFSNIGIFILLPIYVILFGLPGLLIWLVHMLWIPFFAAGVINGIGHHWGYRNFEVKNAATNIVPWGILIGGEELHNNHHAFGYSAKFKIKWWEIDIGWCYIKLLSWLQLCQVKHLPMQLPVASILQDCSETEIMKKLLSNRLCVLERYRHHVIKPLILQNPRSIFGKTKKLLLREPSLVCKQREKLCLEQVLAKNISLQQVYQLSCKLDQICYQTQFNWQTRMQQFKTWCHDAEDTGIHTLVEYSMWLRGYLHPVTTE